MHTNSRATSAGFVLADELAGVRSARPKGKPKRTPSGLRAVRPALVRSWIKTALELGNAGEDGQHHAPRRRRRVGPRFGQRSQAGLGRG